MKPVRLLILALGRDLADLRLRGAAAELGDDPRLFLLLACAVAGLHARGRSAEGARGMAPASAALLSAVVYLHFALWGRENLTPIRAETRSATQRSN